ncbi:hypothetical protein SBA4_1770020 [Candidatus Sulfopaludibacter sp. SbA4]|nr:hypothetical protein SBA4_1770020 [Candidatus Sulfopaludibacter sp. SbA4]
MSFFLLLEYLFDLAHFLLELAGQFLRLAFGLQVWIAGGDANRLLDFALNFVKLAFDLIFCARVHDYSSLFCDRRSSSSLRGSRFLILDL